MKKKGITESDFNRVWSYLVAAFPEANELGELNFEVYFDALHQFSADQILAGIKRFINESGSRFFPSAPQIRAWVSPKMTPEDKTFELAIREHDRREYERGRVLMECLTVMKEKGWVFCQRRMSQDDHYRDTWEWMSLAQATDVYPGQPYELPEILLARLSQTKILPFSGSREHHLLNAVAAWKKDSLEAVKVEQ